MRSIPVHHGHNDDNSAGKRPPEELEFVVVIPVWCIVGFVIFSVFPGKKVCQEESRDNDAEQEKENSKNEVSFFEGDEAFGFKDSDGAVADKDFGDENGVNDDEKEDENFFF